jgi:hypothetical protein
VVGRCDQVMPANSRFARALNHAFDAVASRSVDRTFARCGGCSLSLSFTSATLAEAFLPSFQKSSPANVDLSIAFVAAEQFGFSHLVPVGDQESHLLVTPDTYLAWVPGHLPVLYALERRIRLGFVWLPAGAAPNWELSRPALPIVHALTVNTPWTAVHAGAVSRGGRCLLLAGRGQAGKTTASLACARAGWHYAGDDYVFANSATGRIEPLYCSARLRIDMVEPFADLLRTSAALSVDDGEMRHELRLAGHLGGEIRGGTLAAILLLRRRGATLPSFEPARRVDAYTAVVTVTMLGLPGWPKHITEKLSALVGLAPVYFVDTGSMVDAIPDAFAAFLDRL